MQRLTWAIGLAAVATIALTAAPATAASNDAAIELRNVNRERTAAGLPVLLPDRTLTTLALAHSERMATQGSIFHNLSLGEALPGHRFVGENVGMGPGIGAVHEAFMASAPHRGNILFRGYALIGIGAVRDGNTIFVTQVFASPAPPPNPARTAPPQRSRARAPALAPISTPPPAREASSVPAQGPPARPRRVTSPARRPATLLRVLTRLADDDLTARQAPSTLSATEPATGRSALAARDAEPPPELAHGAKPAGGPSDPDRRVPGSGASARSRGPPPDT